MYTGLSLWETLGVEAETCVTLARTLEYEFVDCRMYVSRGAADVPMPTSVIVACLTTAWRFKEWSASRRLTIGVCSRSCVSALLMGVADHVAFISQGEKPSLFFLNGFRRLEERGKLFLVHASIVSRVSEGVLSELMSDPRVAATYPDLWRSLAEDMSWLIKLPQPLWESLSRVAGVAAEVLQPSCIRCGHVTFHFIWRRFLHPASQLPWSLCRGDLKANLAELEVGASLTSLSAARSGASGNSGTMRCTAESR